MDKPNLDKLTEEARRLVKEAEEIARNSVAAFDAMQAAQRVALSMQPERENPRERDALSPSLNNIIDSVWIESSLQAAKRREKQTPSDLNPMDFDSFMNRQDELLSIAQKSLAEFEISARREAEKRRRFLLAAEESLRTAQEAISCLDSNPEVPAALSGVISALAGSVDSLLSAMKVSE